MIEGFWSFFPKSFFYFYVMKEYYVINVYGQMFAGFKNGDVFWSEKTIDAKPLYNPYKFNFFLRYFPHLLPKLIEF